MNAPGWAQRSGRSLTAQSSSRRICCGIQQLSQEKHCKNKREGAARARVPASSGGDGQREADARVGDVVVHDRVRGRVVKDGVGRRRRLKTREGVLGEILVDCASECNGHKHGQHMVTRTRQQPPKRRLTLFQGGRHGVGVAGGRIPLGVRHHQQTTGLQITR